ncbi:ATP-binding protein [Saccharomonospora sp. NPDC046836]|uniref:ATP-binding protein n=1 Tax=Saccharomonospora sp. NPDC046836 TaxID=3156921 RepID=UPI0033EE64CC
MTVTPCAADELRTLFLFEHLTADQLDRLCREGYVESVEPGVLYREGEPATCFYVLIEGEVVLSRRVGNEDVETTRTSQPGVYAGAWQAYLGDRVPQLYIGTLTVTVPSRFYVLAATGLGAIMREWFPMAVHMLEGLFFGFHNTQVAIGQRERLLALGTLSAGLTHELNNPAAAAVRATASLRERVAGMRHKLEKIAGGRYDRATLETLIKLQEAAAEQAAKAPALSPMEASDREDAVGDWLDEHGIAGGWDLAPTFVAAGIDPDWLDRVIAVLDASGEPDPTILDGAIRWLNYTVETEQLMSEIEDSTTRVSSLVDAAKQYSQLDRAPNRVVDIHDLLESTLTMLTHKIGDGIRVVRDYDRSLPPVPVYAAELNQVWTNLIDNAVDAMEGRGTLTVRTAADGNRVLVEIGDSGPGIPAEIRGRIFDPFYTTKPFGQGTGLGLDISWRIVVNRHHGDIRVESAPGDTRFQVLLPLAPGGE